jgi:hypothetical protein
LTGKKLAHSVRAARARDFVNFRGKKLFMARAARAPWFDWTTTGSDHDRTLRSLLLGGIIENQNSDFVKA